jgi:hypothetical protein
MSLKDNLIQQTEQAVDKLRIRRMDLERDLAQVSAEENEARDMLYFLKNGTVPPVEKNGSTQTTRTLLRKEDVLAMIDEMEEEFIASELASALECTHGAALGWCKKFVKAGVLVVVKQGGAGGNPTIFGKA